MDKLKAKIQENALLTVVLITALAYTAGTLVGNSLAKSVIAAAAKK